MFLDSDLGTLNLVVETYKRRNPAEVGYIKIWPGFETSQNLDTIYPTRRTVCEDRAVLEQKE